MGDCWIKQEISKLINKNTRSQPEESEVPDYYFNQLDWIDYNQLNEHTSFGEFSKAHWVEGIEVGLQYINDKNLPKVLDRINEYLKITDKLNIIRLFGLSETEKYALVIYFEKVKFLGQYLNEITLNQNQKFDIISQILKILKNLHEKRISLNGFNPQNVLIDEIDNHVELSMFTGLERENNLAYTAPEILQPTNTINRESSDIYAFGMIVYRIIFEREPFAEIEDESRLIRDIISGVRPPLQDISPFLKELICKCWDTNPSNRSTIHELEDILLNKPQDFSFSLNDKQPDFFDKNSIECCTLTSFQFYSERLSKSIELVNQSHKQNHECINYYPVKDDEHVFKKFKIDHYESEINIINQDRIINKQKFGDGNSNINFAGLLCDDNIENIKNTKLIIIKRLQIDKNNENLSLKQLNDWSSICKYHDNIVEFLGIIEDEDDICLILPYAHEGNLREYLKNERDVSLNDRIKIAINVADGLLYLHKDLKIIHESLHPFNILMFNGIAKISDLLPRPYVKNYHIFEYVGYVDPSLLLNDKIEKNESMNIYSLGILLWEIASAEIPYLQYKNNLAVLICSIIDDYREEDVSSAPLKYVELYKKCWNKDSSARPKIEDVYDELLNIYNIYESITVIKICDKNDEKTKRKQIESDCEGNDSTKARQKKKAKVDTDDNIEDSVFASGEVEFNNSEESYIYISSESDYDYENEDEDEEVEDEDEDDEDDDDDEDDEDDEDEDEDENKDEARNSEVKWRSLVHNGLYFTKYKPHNVKMKYDGKKVHLEPEAEEIASLFAKDVDTEHAKNKTFKENFFRDFKKVLAKSNKNPPIEEFSKCDFGPIFEYLKREEEGLKARSKEEQLRSEVEYGHCYLDGREEEVVNFRIKRPSLFIGRGNNPKSGSLKPQVQPEEITINIGKNKKDPKPPAGHKWGKVIHDNTLPWLARWKENGKFVHLNVKSILSESKRQRDFKKFEKARELNNMIKEIRQSYHEDLKSKDAKTRQCATVSYFVDHLALRGGHDKKGDTVGCCSLRSEHIKLEPPNTVHFDFLGKDSVRYERTVKVDDQVYENLEFFKKESENNENNKDGMLFDKISATILNNYLKSKSYGKGLTAKVFRTYRASITFQEKLKTPVVGSEYEMIDQAYLKVAELLNHQRTVRKTKNSDNQNRRSKCNRKPSIINEHLKETRQTTERYNTDRTNNTRKKQPVKKTKPTSEKSRKSREHIDNERNGEENETIFASQTSKMNYIDPRISVAFCKKYNVPIEKVFTTEKQRDKFKWAMDVDKHWEF